MQIIRERIAFTNKATILKDSRATGSITCTLHTLVLGMGAPAVSHHHSETLPPAPCRSVRLEVQGDNGLGSGEAGVRLWLQHPTDPSIYADSTGTDADGFALFADISTLIESDETELPTGVQLLQNYPNPFNPRTVITFTTAPAAVVDNSIYSIRSERIRHLLQRTLPAGTHRVAWSGADDRGRAVPASIYFAHLRTAGGRFKTVKMTNLGSGGDDGSSGRSAAGSALVKPADGQPYLLTLAKEGFVTIRDTTLMIEAVFTFDASSSSDDRTPPDSLSAGFRCDADSAWTDWSYDKIRTHKYATPGEKSPAGRIMDGKGQVDTAYADVFIRVPPPTAIVTVDPDTGSIYTVFNFNASGSKDLESPGLEDRWRFPEGMPFTDWASSRPQARLADALVFKVLKSAGTKVMPSLSSPSSACRRACGQSFEIRRDQSDALPLVHKLSLPTRLWSKL